MLERRIRIISVEIRAIRLENRFDIQPFQIYTLKFFSSVRLTCILIQGKNLDVKLSLKVQQFEEKSSEVEALKS